MEQQHVPGTYDPETKVAVFRINQVRYANGNPLSTFAVPKGLAEISVKKALASDNTLEAKDFENPKTGEVMADGWYAKDASDRVEAFGPNVPLVLVAKLNLTGAKIDEDVTTRSGEQRDVYMLDFTVTELIDVFPFDGNELPDGTLPIRRTTATERDQKRQRRLNAPSVSQGIPDAPAPAPTSNVNPF